MLKLWSTLSSGCWWEAKNCLGFLEDTKNIVQVIGMMKLSHGTSVDSCNLAMGKVRCSTCLRLCSIHKLINVYIYMWVSPTKKGHQWWVQCKLCLASPTLPDAGAKDLSHAKSSPLYSYVLQKAGFGEAHLQKKKQKTHSSVVIKLCICQKYESIFEKKKLESKNSRTAMLRIQVFVEPKSCWNMLPRTASRVVANNLQDKSCYMIQA